MLQTRAHHKYSAEPGKWILVWALLLAALWLIPLRAAAEPNSGVGNHFRKAFVSRLEFLEPLRRHGPDAFRITEFPAWGLGWTVEFYPDPKRAGRATGYVAFFDAKYGDEAGWLWLIQRRSDYDDLATEVDNAMAESRLPPVKDGGLFVCSDGPTYVVERRKSGVTTWFEEGCLDDAVAEQLVEQLVDKLPFPLCWYVTLRNPTTGAALDACQNVEPPDVHHADAGVGQPAANPAP